MALVLPGKRWLSSDARELRLGVRI